MDNDSLLPYTHDPETVLDHWEVDPDQGLTGDRVNQLQESYGRNELREAQRRSVWRLLIAQFKSIVIWILVIAAVVAFATGRLPEGIALVAVTVVNTLIGFFSEWKAVRSMEALRDLGQQSVRVRRGGEVQEIPAEELVPGDILLLGGEQLVPADARLLEGQQLRVNEAALTGESVPVNKQAAAVDEETPLAERTCMLYKGTSVVEGEGEAVVNATGMSTELGHIADLAAGAESRETPMQQKLDQLGQRLVWLTLSVAALVAIAGLAVGRETVLMIETAIALGVAAVPEGLPIVATIALARGMWLMSKRNALINRLTAVETLGATRVIFTDKTGTLTQNRMTVQEVVTPDGDYTIEDADAPPGADDDPLFDRLLHIGVLCNNAVLNTEAEQESEGKAESSGDPTEVALLEAGRRFELDRDRLLQEMPEEKEVSFDPETMMMATYHQHEGKLLVAVKGSPEAVLERCDRIGTQEGSRGWEADERESWLERSNGLAKEGLRLLAMADKEVEQETEDPYDHLRFVGLVGMVDPPREDVREAIEECQQAGIRAVMLTGDRPDTGQAIGQRVGLSNRESAVHGSEISEPETLGDEERQHLLKAAIFARVTPEQKLRLVKLYQDSGLIVAMTGDGVNDAPALRQADIGVAMGQRGTDAAKQMADMVLRDDKFDSIVAAVRQGRIIFANIRKSVIFMLCTNLAEILAVTVASLAMLPIPLRPLQILFLNVLTDVFPALALGIGAGSGNVMRYPPRASDESVLTRHHWLAISGWSVVIFSCVLTSLLLALHWLGFDERSSITVSFLTLGFSKLWFPLNLRDRGSRLWNNDVVTNPWMGGALLLCISLLLLAVYWSPLASALQTAAPGRSGWLLILGMSLVPAVLGIFAPGIRFYAATVNGESNDQEETADKPADSD